MILESMIQGLERDEEQLNIDLETSTADLRPRI